MSTIKCRNCGLVNFSTEQSCKRCRLLFASEGNAPAKFKVSDTPPPPPVFHGGEAPPPPSSETYPCIKCGDRQRTAIRNFVKIYHSPVAILGILFGCLPYILLKLLLRTKHDLTGPFCETCWLSYQTGRTYSVVNIVLFFVIPIAGLAFSIYIDSPTAELWLLGSFILSLFVLAIGERYIATFGPKYKRVTSKEVIVDAPYVGEIVYTRSA